MYNFADISLVRNVELIEKSQALILECLLYLFQKYHSNDRLRFAQFMSCLLLARTIKEHHVRAEESFASEWGTQVDFPPLLYEIWSSWTWILCLNWRFCCSLPLRLLSEFNHQLWNDCLVSSDPKWTVFSGSFLKSDQVCENQVRVWSWTEV